MPQLYKLISKRRLEQQSSGWRQQHPRKCLNKRPQTEKVSYNNVHCPEANFYRSTYRIEIALQEVKVSRLSYAGYMRQVSDTTASNKGMPNDDNNNYY